jgi:V8-like Glu-specific endopeptidase
MPQVHNSTTTPYDTVVLLRIELDTGEFAWGSGALLNDKHVLTCGHNLISRQQRYEAVRVTAFPGYSSAQRPDPADGFAARHGFYCDPFVSRQDRGWDIGVVRLAASIARPIYMIPFPVDSEPDQPLRIAGFPANRHFRMWEDEEVWTGVDIAEHVFAYAHETEAGSSGSPIFQYREIARTLRQFGVHSGLAENLDDKVGVLITRVTAMFIASAVGMHEPLPSFLRAIPAPTAD